MTLLHITLRAWFTALIWLALAMPESRADHYVAQNGQTPAGLYATWETAASNIQDAVNASAPNSTVWIGAGRYTKPANAVFYTVTNVVYIDKPLMLRSSNGIPASVIIDGGGANRGLTWYYNAASTSGFVLDGLTISNCAATNVGGGIYFVPLNSSWTATVQNCSISDNIVRSKDAAGYAAGGGLYVQSFAGFGLTVSNCVIRNNVATNTLAGTISQAGGMYMYSSGKKLLTGCTIENNRSGAYGGGMYFLSYEALVENCIFRSNRCEQGDNNTSGGAMHLTSGTITLRNCLIYNNYGSYSGGGIYKFASPVAPENYGLLTVLNCTIVSNIASYGSAVYVRRADRLSFANSIIYSNLVGVGTVSAYPHYFTNNWINQREITNGVNGVGNITNGIGPGFINTDGQDYRLTADSPCFNAGTNQDWMTGAIDLDGRKRIRHGCVDMGAYELLQEATVYRFK